MSSREYPTTIDKGKGPKKRLVPLPFLDILNELVASLDIALCAGSTKDTKAAAEQCRLRSDDPVTTGLVQMLLELEYDKGESASENSFMDRLLDGLITAQSKLSDPGELRRQENLMPLHIQIAILRSRNLLGRIISKPYFALRFHHTYSKRSSPSAL